MHFLEIKRTEYSQMMDSGGDSATGIPSIVYNSKLLCPDKWLISASQASKLNWFPCKLLLPHCRIFLVHNILRKKWSQAFPEELSTQNWCIGILIPSRQPDSCAWERISACNPCYGGCITTKIRRNHSGQSPCSSRITMITKVEGLQCPRQSNAPIDFDSNSPNHDMWAAFSSRLRQPMRVGKLGITLMCAAWRSTVWALIDQVLFTRRLVQSLQGRKDAGNFIPDHIRTQPIH